MEKVTLGGDRLGAGKKNEIGLHNYERSTQDLSNVIRTTMSAGTLVPFMGEISTPGDDWEIDLDIDVKTMPTIGPLFGSYKVQLDVFQVPIRLYQGALHMNLLGVGLNIDEIKLPQVKLTAERKELEVYTDGSQVNNSCIFAYQDIRGLGFSDEIGLISREFNATKWLAYWDIYKQYYSNKQEGIGAVIHNNMNVFVNPIQEMFINTNGENWEINAFDIFSYNPLGVNLAYTTIIKITFTNSNIPRYDEVQIQTEVGKRNLTELFGNLYTIDDLNMIVGENPIGILSGARRFNFYGFIYDGSGFIDKEIPKIVTFNLEDIDSMKKKLLKMNDVGDIFKIDENETLEPYRMILKKGNTNEFPITSKQEGLALKTYQSDLFNNWISTEWLDGTGGINDITAVDTSDGNFTLNSLMLSRKIFDMLNRIAVSGGTYDDYLNAVYTHDRVRSVESPMYCGGLIRELAFQEVVSNAETDGQPLGTLAGKGVMTQKKKGGYIKIKVSEPSYVIGIVSITPRVDYSQGNKWDNNLKNIGELHKPALDEIGYQDLITDQMAWWDTDITTGQPKFKSAGKVPAWINYMTNVNTTYGNFADEANQMFMTLNRKYEKEFETNGKCSIKDLTTYIDPSKYNNIFAETRLDAMNFWVQISKDIKVRRKMSAKVMPNL